MPKKKPGKRKAGQPERVDMAKELAKATREMERNKRLIEAGKTYRSRKPKVREKSPSHYKPFV